MELNVFDSVVPANELYGGGDDGGRVDGDWTGWHRKGIGMVYGLDRRWRTNDNLLTNGNSQMMITI